MRQAMQWLAATAVLLVVGGGGWRIWKLTQERDQTIQRLQATQATLEQRQQALTMLEEEQHKLSEAYETLKQRWVKSDAEVARLTEASTQLTQQLDGLTKERAELQRRAEALQADSTKFQQQAGALDSERANLAKENSGLAAQLQTVSNEAQHKAAQLEQVQSALDRELTVQDALRDHLLDVSHAYEETARHLVAMNSATPSTSQRAASAEPSGANANDWRAERALAYRKIGLAYANVHDNRLAIRYLEQAIALHDDPDTRARLAQLNTARDESTASETRAPQTQAIPSAEPRTGPRKSWPLVWDWLTR